MVCAADADRDQSYFLFATTREQLDYLRFPLGDMTKQQTRELARRFGLAVADKHDSQDICFVPTGRYTDIISRLRRTPSNPATSSDLDDRVIGRHQGIVHFTVGQRRGLGIASDAPLYVVRLDAVGRRVRGRPARGVAEDRIVLRDVNWIGDGALDRAVGDGLEIFVRVRSTRAPQPAWLRAAGGGYEVELVAGEEGVSPGQACVFYECAVRPRRACSAADSSKARPRRAQRRGQRRATLSLGSRSSSNARIKFQGGAWLQISTALGSQGLMSAGRRSTIWYSARFSITAASRPSPRPTRSADADSRCRCRHRIVAVGYSRTTKLCWPSIFPKPMLRKAQQRVRCT